MPSHHTLRRKLFALAAAHCTLAVTPAASAGSDGISPFTAGSSRWKFSLGASHRAFDTAGFRSGSFSQPSFLPQLANATGIGDLSAGPATGFADRTYADGYVFIDSGTVAGGGDTWFWGYDSTSQIRGDTLSFQGGFGTVSDFSSSSSLNAPGSWAGDETATGTVAQLDYTITQVATIDFAASLQWGFFQVDGQRRDSNFSAQQTSSLFQQIVTDVFDTSGIIVPGAPYRGTFIGPGPLLPNEPISRDLSLGPLIAQDIVTFANSTFESFDVSLNTLSLGPTLSRSAGRFQFSLSGGLGLNIVNYDAAFSENLFAQLSNGTLQTIRSWSDSSSGTEILLGSYLQASVGYRLTDHLGLSLFGRGDWSDELTARVGPSTFTFDPSGWSAGGMVSWSF